MKESRKTLALWCAFIGVLFLAAPFPAQAGDYPDTVIETIPVGQNPWGVAITPDGSSVYVANEISHAVSVIRTSDDTVVDEIYLGGRILAVAVTPDGQHVYVTMTMDDKVAVIRTSDNVVIKKISVGQAPYALAITPDGSRLYVANYGDIAVDTVSVIRTSDNTVIKTIAVGDMPVGVAIHPNGNYVYVTTYGSAAVYVIRTSDNTVVDTISVGNHPKGVAVTPDGSHVYVGNKYAHTVSVIRTSDNTVIKTLSVGSRPTGLASTPNGNYVYVTNEYSNTVSVIRTSDNTVAHTISVGTRPVGVGITPDGTRVYVANFTSHTVSVIDGTSLADTYVVLDRGPGYARGLNDAGDVVGFTDAWAQNGSGYVWEWQSPARDELPLPSGMRASMALSINDGRQIVGAGFDTSGGTPPVHAYLWDKDSNGIWQALPLGTLGGTYSMAFEINNNGQVVGWADSTSGARRGFLWPDPNTGGMHELPTFGGRSPAMCINDIGKVAGFSSTSGFSNNQQAYVWEYGDATLTPLNEPSRIQSEAMQINQTGQIVGTSQGFGSGSHAVIWDNETSTAGDLGTLGGTISYAHAINNNGHVVGSTQVVGGQSHAFLWQDVNGDGNGVDAFGNLDPGEMQDLNDVLPPNSGWVLEAATDINASGWIVGFGSLNGEQHGFLLVPEPVSLEQVATPSFSPNGGRFTGSVDVTIECATSGATIRYTTDASDPSSTHGEIYDGSSVYLTETTVLKAIGYKTGFDDSEIRSRLFTKVFEDIFFSDFDYNSVDDPNFLKYFIDEVNEDTVSFGSKRIEGIDRSVMTLRAFRPAYGTAKTSRVETRSKFGPRGSYAAYVQFNNADTSGDGDVNNQDFYAINQASGEDYSEIDFEWLTQKGWDGEEDGDFLQVNSWWTKEPEEKQWPGRLYPHDTLDGKGSFLVFTVGSKENLLSKDVTYYLNRDRLPHTVPEEYRPRLPMEIHFSNWFYPDNNGPGHNSGQEDRWYKMHVDYVFYSADIMSPNDVESKVNEIRGSLQCQTTCPVDIIVTDPDGLMISKDLNEIPNARYVEEDVNDDGDPDDTVTITRPTSGTYSVHIVPEPGADPNATVTLTIRDHGQISIPLEQVRVADLPTEPIVINVDRTPPTLSISATPNVLGPVGVMVPVQIDVQVQDETDPDPGVGLVSIEPSWEADPSDITGADYGEDDRDFELRAACNVTGGRTYTITYAAADATGNIAEASTTVTVPRLVQIDIKPGSSTNSINLGSFGLIPVAILTTDDFDATTVDATTVELAGSTVAIRGKGTKWLAATEDVDGDGDLDLMLHIITANLWFESGSTEAILTGQTYSGEPITGSDSIVIVKE